MAAQMIIIMPKQFVMLKKQLKLNLCPLPNRIKEQDATARRVSAKKNIANVSIQG
jgi:hypothetical protein